MSVIGGNRYCRFFTGLGADPIRTVCCATYSPTTSPSSTAPAAPHDWQSYHPSPSPTYQYSPVTHPSPSSTHARTYAETPTGCHSYASPHS